MKDCKKNSSSDTKENRKHCSNNIKPSNARRFTIRYCNKCPFYTSNLKMYQKHQRAHNNPSSYHCKLCPYLTVMKALIEKHTINKHGIMHKHAFRTQSQSIEKVLKCDLCSFTTSFPHALRTHKMIHKKEPDKCPHCDFKTRLEFLMIKHIKHKHQDKSKSIPMEKNSNEVTNNSDSTVKVAKCEECGFVAKHYKTLLLHVQAHKADFRYKCPHCLFIHTLYKSFRIHMRKQHPLEPITVQRNPLERGDLTCPKCDYQSQSLENLEKHSLEHSQEQKFQCDSCEFNGVTFVHLLKHIKDNHPPNLSKKCSKCPFSTNKLKSFRVHVLAHTDPNSLRCSLCWFLTLSHRSFASHMSSTHPTVNYRLYPPTRLGDEDEQVEVDEDVCDMNQTFEYEKDNPPHAHEEKHVSDECSIHNTSTDEVVTKKAKFACDKCNYTTFTSVILEAHRKRHDFDKSFVCEECGYISVTLYSFKKHVYTKHPNSNMKYKVYRCDICEFTCASSIYLKAHVRAHNNVNSYKCDHCAFLSETYIGICHHIGSKHKELLAEITVKSPEVSYIRKNEYVCYECKEKFKDPQSYDDHIQNRHPSSENLYELGKTKSETSFFIFFCAICRYECGAYSDLENHFLIHDPLVFCCEDELDSLKAFEELLRSDHKRDNDMVPNYVCNYCEFSSEDPDCAAEHQQGHSLDEKAMVIVNDIIESETSDPTSAHICEICSHDAKHSSNLDNHVYAHFSRDKFSCQFCTFLTTNKDSHRLHIKHQHGHTVTDTDEMDLSNFKDIDENMTYSFATCKFICKLCGFEEPKCSRMRKHINLHNNPAALKCNLCEFKSLSQFGLAIHYNRRHKDECPRE